MWECRHCLLKFDFVRTTEKANHSRHCSLNPNKIFSYKNLKIAQHKLVESKLGIKKNFNVKCTNCKTIFFVTEREHQFPTKEKYFCSRSCSNAMGGIAKAKKYYVSDENSNYVTVGWRYHEKKCIVCNEQNIVAIHHYNENHEDNRPENLVPLCPTHHNYMHSRFIVLIKNIVDKYIENFINSLGSQRIDALLFNGELVGVSPTRVH